MQIFHIIFEAIQRVQHVKIESNVENIVRNYNIDFIIHFRLSRQVAYRLIDEFSISEIFISLRGIFHVVKKINIYIYYIHIVYLCVYIIRHFYR